LFSLLQIIAILLTATAAFAWVNYALLKLPNTIGLLIMGLLASLLLVGLDAAFPSVELFHRLIETVQDIDFSKTLLDGMLAFLLFAGALHVDFSRLRGRGLIIGIMATIGVVISTAVVAGGVWWVSRAIGSPLPFAWALVFGALISPTDPVAVLNTLKNMAVPETLETDMVGESLFNDGVGVVLFAILLAAAGGSAGVDLPHIAHLFFAAAAVPLVLRP
jgi:monovalent cation:H+ antiporter, CPA1 family